MMIAAIKQCRAPPIHIESEGIVFSCPYYGIKSAREIPQENTKSQQGAFTPCTPLMVE